MTKNQQGATRRAEEGKQKISQHKKSAKVSSSRQKSTAKNKNIQKTGSADDDWNDPTGNSHISSSNKH